MPKSITRCVMDGLVFLVMLPFWLVFCLLMLLIFPFYFLALIWSRVELWAYYDNDKVRRDKDRWRYS